jgi:hypothetical protein
MSAESEADSTVERQKYYENLHMVVVPELEAKLNTANSALEICRTKFHGVSAAISLHIEKGLGLSPDGILHVMREGQLICHNALLKNEGTHQMSNFLCDHTPVFNRAADNYYCSKCHCGMGNAYYGAAKRAEKIQIKLDEALKKTQESESACAAMRDVLVTMKCINAGYKSGAYKIASTEPEERELAEAFFTRLDLTLPNVLELDAGKSTREELARSKRVIEAYKKKLSARERYYTVVHQINDWFDANKRGVEAPPWTATPELEEALETATTANVNAERAFHMAFVDYCKEQP